MMHWMDYTRIPELQEHLPYLQEQAKDWVTWDGKPLENGFDSGSLRAWTSADEVALNFENYRDETALAEINICGRPCGMDPHLGVLAALHGRLDVEMQILSLHNEIEHGRFGSSDVQASAKRNFTSMLAFNYFGPGVGWTMEQELVQKWYLHHETLYLGKDDHSAKSVITSVEDNAMFQNMPPFVHAPWTQGAVISSILCGAIGDGIKKEDIYIPSPAECWEGSEMGEGAGYEQMPAFGNYYHNMNCTAAEANLLIGRFDDAMEHADRFEANCWGCHVPAVAPWLKARIVSAKAKAVGAADTDPVYKEVAALLQQAVTASRRFESPLLVALTLQDLLALAPACVLGGAARAQVESESEEAKFELTMPEEGVPCALAKHLELGEAFALRYLGK